MMEPALSSSLFCGGSFASLGALLGGVVGTPGCREGFCPRREDRAESPRCTAGAPGMLGLMPGLGAAAGGATEAVLTCDVREEADLMESCL